MGMMPWGALLLGSLASRLGVSNAVTIGGSVVIAASLVAYFNRRGSEWAMEQVPAE